MEIKKKKQNGKERRGRNSQQNERSGRFGRLVLKTEELPCWYNISRQILERAPKKENRE